MDVPGVDRILSNGKRKSATRQSLADDFKRISAVEHTSQPNRHACTPLLTNTLSRLQNTVDGTVV